MTKKKNNKKEQLFIPMYYNPFDGNIYGLGGAITGAAGSVIGAASKAVERGKGVDTSAMDAETAAYANKVVSAGSKEDLLNQMANRNRLRTDKTKYDITGGSVMGDILGGVGSFASDVGSGIAAGSGLDAAIKKSKEEAYGGPIKHQYGSGGLILGAVNGAINLAGQIAGIFNDAKNMREANQRAAAANARQDRAYSDAIDNMNKQDMGNLLATSYAFGGPFGYFDDGAIGYDMMKDSLYNKQLMAQVKAAPSLFNNTFAEGGNLNSDFGDFTNDVIHINTGGTHEENPYGGVGMGKAEDGEPNSVEEGEVIYNDYVFSNRLKVPKAIRKKYKLRGSENMTYAQAFKEIQKESKERENDPISENGLNYWFNILADSQEQVRASMGLQGANAMTRMAALGGHIFSGTDDNPPYIEDEENEEAPSGTYIPSQNLKSNNEESLDAYKARLEADAKKHRREARQKFFNNLFGKGDLRYLEPLGNLGVVASDIMGITNTPTKFDYISPYRGVSYKPLSNYIAPKEFDIRDAANKQAQLAANTAYNIMNTTGLNKYANLLNADYQAQIAQGDLLRKESMDAYDREIKREEFNRATDSTNNEGFLKADMTNSENELRYAQALLNQAKENDAADTFANTGRATNASNLLASLSNVQRDLDAIDALTTTIESSARGLNDSQLKYVYRKNPDAAIRIAQDQGKSPEEIKALFGAFGGKLRKKKKRGLTY